MVHNELNYVYNVGTCADKLSPLGSLSEEVKTGKSQSEERKQPKDYYKGFCRDQFLRSSICTTADYKSRVMGRSFTIQSFVPFLVKFMQVQNGFIRDKERYLDSLNISDCRGRGKTNNRTERKDSLAHVF